MVVLKRFYQFAIVGLLFILVIASKEDPPTPAEQVDTKLQEIDGQYLANAVTLDGNDVSGEYSGMIITLTAQKTYSTSPGDYDPVWSASGTFLFKDETSNPPVLTSFIRDDDVEVEYTLSGSTMTFSFTIPNPYGKLSGIDGEYEFVCTKN